MLEHNQKLEYAIHMSKNISSGFVRMIYGIKYWSYRGVHKTRKLKTTIIFFCYYLLMILLCLCIIFYRENTLGNRNSSTWTALCFEYFHEQIFFWLIKLNSSAWTIFVVRRKIIPYEWVIFLLLLDIVSATPHEENRISLAEKKQTHDTGSTLDSNHLITSEILPGNYNWLTIW